MIKALFLFPVMVFALVFCLIGGAFLLPALALLPVIAAIGIAGLAFTLVFGIFGVLLRVFAAITVGIGGLVFGAMGLILALAGGVAILAVGALAIHLLLPILIIAGIVWLIHHFAKPAAPLQIEHKPT